MQFSKIALLLPLVLSSVIATPVREEQLPNQLEVTDNVIEEAGNALAKRGFFCPIDWICNQHVGHSTSRRSPAAILIHKFSAKTCKADEPADTASSNGKYHLYLFVVGC